MTSEAMRLIGYRKFDDDGVTLTALSELAHVDGLGLVVRVSLYDQRTYSGPTATVVLGDDAGERVAAAVARLEVPGAARAALGASLSETLGLDEARFDESMFAPTEADEARRSASLDVMTGLFPAVEQRFSQVYGLRLPRHVAVLAAALHSLGDHERRALQSLGLSDWGVLDYFADGGLERAGRDGLDERLHCRFRRDPAELVTILGGGSDGLHYGLWYDDPAELPSFVAYNYARDSAETWTAKAPTGLAQIRRVLDDALDDDEDPERYWTLYPLRAVLDWFDAADAAACAADGPPRWADAQRPPGGVTLGAVLPPDSGDPRVGETEARHDAYRGDEERTRGWIAEATAELAAGRPAFALVLGRELHWLDADRYRREAVELLAGAYRALGRDALAGIAEVHAANRDLPSVDVLQPR
ncbi:ADP-ribosylation family protein [Dactylosporangium maewongense]|uniref:ADP-ribosylation family protein n=1 Tax=Dactylosporangium maewongense TaxID=634393 RepID=UPI0031D00856